MEIVEFTRTDSYWGVRFSGRENDVVGILPPGRTVHIHRFEDGSSAVCTDVPNEEFDTKLTEQTSKSKALYRYTFILTPALTAEGEWTLDLKELCGLLGTGEQWLIQEKAIVVPLGDTNLCARVELYGLGALPASQPEGSRIRLRQSSTTAPTVKLWLQCKENRPMSQTEEYAARKCAQVIICGLEARKEGL